jgi:hypothetical protein
MATTIPAHIQRQFQYVIRLSNKKVVYGFSMTGMLENVYNKTLIRFAEPGEIAAENVVFLEFDLY